MDLTSFSLEQGFQGARILASDDQILIEQEQTFLHGAENVGGLLSRLAQLGVLLAARIEQQHDERHQSDGNQHAQEHHELQPLRRAPIARLQLAAHRT
jgi:hypothetical protein